MQTFSGRTSDAVFIRDGAADPGLVRVEFGQEPALPLIPATFAGLAIHLGLGF